MEIFKILGTIALDNQAANDGIDQTTKKAKSSSSSISTAFKKVGTVVAAAFSVKAVADFGKACFNAATTAETAFAKVTTLLADGTDTDAYFDSIKKASAETGVAVDDFSEAVYASISASVAQEDAVQFTQEAIKLAKGGFTDAATAVDVLTTAINAYGMDASDATKISDMLITTQNLGKTTVDELASSMGRIIPTANAFNVDIETLCGAYAVMTKNGIATAESTTYMNSMLNELGKSGTDAADLLKQKTGKSFAELMDMGCSLSYVLEILEDGARQNGETLNDVFGSSEAAKAASLLASQSEDLDASIIAMGESAGATEAAYDKMTSTMEEKLQRLKNKFNLLQVALGEKLSPAVGWVADKLTVLVDFLSDNLEPALQWVSATFRSVGGYLSSTFAPVIENVRLIFGKVKAAVQPMLDKLKKFASFGQYASAAASFLKNACQAIADKLAVLTGFIADNFEPVMERLQEIFQTVSEYLSGKFEPVVEGVKEIFTGLKNAIQPLVSSLKSYITSGQAASDASTFLNNALTWLKTVVKWCVEIFVSLQTAVVSVAGHLSDTFAPVAENVREIVAKLRDIFEAVKEKLSAMKDSTQEVTNKFAEYITSGGLARDATNLLKAAVEFVASALETMTDWIISAIDWLESFWTENDELKNGITAIWETIKGYFTTAWETIKLVWDAASPYFSQIWEEIKLVFSVVVDVLGACFSAAWDYIMGIWEAASGYFSEVWENIKAVFNGEIDPRTFFNNIFQAGWDAIAQCWEAAAQFFVDIWEGIKAVFSTDDGGAVLSGAFTMAWDAIELCWSFVVGYFQAIWDGICGVFSDVGQWFNDNVITPITDYFAGLGEAITALFKSAWDSICDAWNGASTWFNDTVISPVSGFFSGVAETISQPFTTAYDSIKGVWDGIAGWFQDNVISPVKSALNFSWTWPTIPMPHFGITPKGWSVGDLLNGIIPTLGVEWYAKAMDKPLLMDKPTAFGVNGDGQIMAGGEAGSEVVSGTDTLMNMISQAVAAQNAGLENALGAALDGILELLSEYMPQMAAKQLVVDGGSVATALSPIMDSTMGRTAMHKGRGN